jgi:SAM-dependent methyltransferase
MPGPHTVARTAVVWDVLRRELDRQPGITLNVVDVGGGTGGFAVPLAEVGHHVLVVDPSPDALAALTRRAADAGVAGRVRAVQGDADALAGLIDPESADLVLCHSVLEVVDAPAECVTALAHTLRPGGAASVIVANRMAAVLGRAMVGQLDQAAALLADADGHAAGRDTVRRRFDVVSASTLLSRSGLVVEQVHGVRVVADLVPAGVGEREQEALTDFELTAATVPALRDVASQLHLLARRP